MGSYVLILVINGMNISGVTSVEFNTFDACKTAITAAEQKWRVDAICVPKG